MVSSAMHPLRGIPASDRWLRGLLVGAVLAVTAASGSYAAEETPSPATANALSAEPESGATPRPPTARAPRRHYSPGEIIDANVDRLAHGLELDPEQQTNLREILVDHYQALTKLRTAAPGTDRSGAMLAIVARTRQWIRTILNDAQKQKYSTDVSTELAGPSRADLEHWLEVRDAAATQAPGPSPKEN